MTFGNQCQYFARVYLRSLVQTAHVNGQVINLFTVHPPKGFNLCRWVLQGMQALTQSKLNSRIRKKHASPGIQPTFSCHAYVIWHFYHGTADFSKKFERTDLTIVSLIHWGRKEGTVWLTAFTLACIIFYIKINLSWCIPGNTWFWWITVFQSNLFPLSAVEPWTKAVLHTEFFERNTIWIIKLWSETGI